MSVLTRWRQWRRARKAVPNGGPSKKPLIQSSGVSFPADPEAIVGLLGALGLPVGAAFVALMGQITLALVLLAVGAGFGLRFRRLRRRRRARATAKEVA